MLWHKNRTGYRASVLVGLARLPMFVLLHPTDIYGDLTAVIICEKHMPRRLQSYCEVGLEFLTERTCVHPALYPVEGYYQIGVSAAELHICPARASVSSASAVTLLPSRF